MLTAFGCASNVKRLTAAAETQGQVRAGVNLPDLPAECRQKMARVVPKYGIEKPRNTQLRWEFSADSVDQRFSRCAAFYDTTKTNFEKTLTRVRK